MSSEANEYYLIMKDGEQFAVLRGVDGKPEPTPESQPKARRFDEGRDAVSFACDDCIEVRTTLEAERELEAKGWA